MAQSRLSGAPPNDLAAKIWQGLSGKIDSRIGKAQELFLGTMTRGCDGLPRINPLDGSGCDSAATGQLVLYSNLHGMPTLVSTVMNPQLSGSAGQVADIATIPISVDPCATARAGLRARRRFRDDDGNLWDANGALISSGGPTFTVVQTNAYIYENDDTSRLNGTVIGNRDLGTGFTNNESAEDPYAGDQGAAGLASGSACFESNGDVALCMESRILTRNPASTVGYALPNIRRVSDLSLVCRFADPSDMSLWVDGSNVVPWFMVTADEYGLWWVQQMGQPVIRAYRFVRSPATVILVETVTFTPDPGYGLFQRRAQPIYL